MAVRIFEAKDQLGCPRLKKSGECEPSECDESIWSFNGEDFRGCPVKLVTAESVGCLRAYQLYKDRFLPRPGGFLDQGMLYIEAMEVIDAQMQLIEQERDRARQNLSKGNK